MDFSKQTTQIVCCIAACKTRIVSLIAAVSTVVCFNLAPPYSSLMADEVMSATQQTLQPSPPPSKATSQDAYERCLENSDGTNPAWIQCGATLIAQADERLNIAWQDALSKVTTPDGKAALLADQQAWLKFRERSCMIYNTSEFGREAQVLSFGSCRANEIDHRTAQLNIYIHSNDPN